jgi:hypothetical protein
MFARRHAAGQGIVCTLARSRGPVRPLNFRRIDDNPFPEWQPFVDAVRSRPPDAGTWCEALTVRDIVAHEAGNAEELARVLAGHLNGKLVGTRGFAEREAALRGLSNDELGAALHAGWQPSTT